jgi:hypothetical protein
VNVPAAAFCGSIKAPVDAAPSARRAFCRGASILALALGLTFSGPATTKNKAMHTIDTKPINAIQSFGEIFISD